MRAGVQCASRLACSAIREEICMCNWSSNASSDEKKGRSVGVQCFDIISIASIQTIRWIIDTEKWASRIKAENL